MQLLHTHRSPQEQASSTPFIARRQPIQSSAQIWQEQPETRHDAQMLTQRAIPADPYEAWLREREAERFRAEIA